MSGLLLKDIYVLWKSCRGYILMVLFVGLVPLFSENGIFNYYSILLLGMLPISVASLDENSKWDSYSATLSCSRAQLVSEKYILTLLLTAVGAVLSIAVQAISAGFAMDGVRGALDSVGEMGENIARTRNLPWSLADSLRQMAMVILPYGLLPSAVMLPLVYKLGMEKARLGIFVLAGGIAVLTVLFDRGMGERLSEAGIAAWAVPAACLVFYAFSWLLSCRIYQKKEL